MTRNSQVQARKHELNAIGMEIEMIAMRDTTSKCNLDLPCIDAKPLSALPDLPGLCVSTYAMHEMHTATYKKIFGIGIIPCHYSLWVSMSSVL